MAKQKAIELFEQLSRMPQTERKETILKLSQTEKELLKDVLELVEQKEAALKRKLEAVEAHTEMLKANMELIGRFVKPKGNA